MNNEINQTAGCSEEFAELCALSTSGELSREEMEIFNEHIAGCAPCASLLREYTSLATIGMAKIAGEYEPEIESSFRYNQKGAEERFAAILHMAKPVKRYSHGMKRWGVLGAMAAGLVLCVALGYQTGRKAEAGARPSVAATVVVPAPPAKDPEVGRLKKELDKANLSLKTVNAKSADLEQRLAEFSGAKKSLQAQIDRLTQQKNSVDTALLTSMAQERDSLQQQLKETSGALVRAKEDLNRVQQDRQGALFRVASLESEINSLHENLAETNKPTNSDDSLLAADRDIRELMGARQLYIADVFDVQNNGERSKAFGRVFYTKGKSLVFFAFDLQDKPGYRQTKVFQAWGKPNGTSRKPVSLGVFYEDSAKNRRWVVKADNPDVLERINAVFVTVEPHSGSQAPTGKPFLEAYLHSLPPNHP